MRRLPARDSHLAVNAISLAIAFIFGFCAHSLWIRRSQIINYWNDVFLYYQD